MNRLPPLFKVQKAGVYASIQDKGRIGYQQFGVPVSGAMDSLAYEIGNLLVGNKRNQASLEIMYMGVELEALDHHTISITGADLDARVDGRPLKMWRPFDIKRGQILSFKGMKKGAISYLSVNGGLKSPKVLNSYSVYPRGGIGQSLQIGEVIHTNEGTDFTSKKGLYNSHRPRYEKEIIIRVITGSHMDRFEPGSIEDFFQQTYQLTRGDRMGYLLKGEKPLRHKENSDIFSEATTFGSLQVPSNGQPIILMADSQTTGGYTTIGRVITADLWKVAQLPVGGKITFEKVTLEEAVNSLKEQELFLKIIERGITQ